jgi:hypothetical protein
VAIADCQFFNGSIGAEDTEGLLIGNWQSAIGNAFRGTGRAQRMTGTTRK